MARTRHHHHRQPKPGTVPPAEGKPAAKCPHCGKDCYTSKRLARQVARRRFPGEQLRAYPCDGSPYWHLTSRDADRTARMRDLAARGLLSRPPGETGGRPATEPRP